MHTVRTAMAALTLSVLTALLVASPVAATPVETGCPSAFVPRTVTEWEAMGYHAPAVIDASGNQDGFVCGLAMPYGFLFGWAVTANGLSPTVDVLYEFTDDNNPARQ
jgi:hypothetical protein